MALMDIPKIKESLREAALRTHFDEYKELAQTWRGLEGKAQGAIAVAGIFIGGAFAYIRDINPGTRLYEKVFLGMTVVFLIISVILSVLVLKTRKIPSLPLGRFVSYYVKHLVKVEAEKDFQEYLSVFFSSHSERWLAVTSRMYEVNRLKAKYLWLAQLSLMAAILTVACLTILNITIR
jgi:hypothetical protein